MVAGAWLVMLLTTQVPEAGALPAVPMFGKQPMPYVAPGRIFSVQVPSGWGVIPHEEDPNTVEFRGVGRPGDAFLIVRRVTVPLGAHPRQLLMVALEQRLAKLPSFRVAAKRDVVISGNRAASVVGTYAFQGNLQFPRALEEIYVVVGTEAFVFHFECFEPAAGELAADVNALYQSFLPRPPGAAGGPFAPSGSGPIDTDAVPF